MRKVDLFDSKKDFYIEVKGGFIPAYKRNEYIGFDVIGSWILKNKKTGEEIAKGILRTNDELKLNMRGKYIDNEVKKRYTGLRKLMAWIKEMTFVEFIGEEYVEGEDINFETFIDDLEEPYLG